jgi:hypothetical protein
MFNPWHQSNEELSIQKSIQNIYWFISRIQIQQLIMFYRNKDNNQHIYFQEAWSNLY